MVVFLDDWDLKAVVVSLFMVILSTSTGYICNQERINITALENTFFLEPGDVRQKAHFSLSLQTPKPKHTLAELFWPQ